MVISEVLNRWFTSIKRVAFKYNDGFFQLPLVSNSPESIIKSLARMPFVYNDSEKEIFGTKNPFINATVPYHKIEEGLWIFYSQAYYKENINYLREKNKDLTNNYSKLYLEINSNKTNHKNVLLNGTPYSNSCWVLHKPFNESSYCKFKGCKTVSIVLHFDRSWLINVLESKGFYKDCDLPDFFKSKAESIIIPYEPNMARHLEMKTKSLFEEKERGVDTTGDWQLLAMEFFERFISRFKEENIHSKMFDFAHADRVKLAKVEKILMDELYGTFMGIEYLASQVAVSPTKLKRNFKLVYGTSIFQYFRSEQMKHAKLVLQKNSGYKIQEIAQMFGYNNMTKFANAYKTVHGVFPSEVRSTR